MKQLFLPRLTALTLALILVLLLPGCTQSAPEQTDKVSVDKPPVAEQPKTDESLTQTTEKEVKKEDKKDDKTELEEVQQLFEKLLADAEILDTSSWQTFSNPQRKYQFKYPRSWYHVGNVKDNTSFDTFSPLKPTYTDTYYGMLGPDSGTIIIDVAVGNGQYTPKSYGENLIFQIKDGSSDQIYLSFDTTFVNGGKSTEKRYYADVYWQNKTYYCHLIANIYNLNLEDKNNDINVLKTILTTFKFVSDGSK